MTVLDGEFPRLLTSCHSVTLVFKCLFRNTLTVCHEVTDLAHLAQIRQF